MFANAFTIFFVFIIIMYLIPLTVCLLNTIISMIKSFFRNTTISQYDKTYVKPLTVKIFLSRVILSIMPIFNFTYFVIIVADLKTIKRFFSYIDYILNIEPHVSIFKKDK